MSTPLRTKRKRGDSECDKLQNEEVIDADQTLESATKRIKCPLPDETFSTHRLLDSFQEPDVIWKEASQLSKIELDETKKQNANERLKWPRPPLEKPINPITDDLYFMQMDPNYVNTEGGNTMESRIAQNRLSLMPEIRLFGVTAQGHSVLARIFGFMPYFYVPVSPDLLQTDGGLDAVDAADYLCREFRQALSKQLSLDKQVKDWIRMDDPTTYVVEVSLEYKMSLMYYRTDKSPFLRVTMALPGHVSIARRICEQGLSLVLPGQQVKTKLVFPTFESNVAFVSRHMIDSSMTGASWVKIKAGGYQLPFSQISTCQIEVCLHYSSLVALSPTQSEWSKVAPLRIMSSDIECYHKGGFPSAETDPIIQISTYLVEYSEGKCKAITSNVITSRTCSPVVGVDIRIMDSEEELLEEWAEMMVEMDPDFLVGYNIMNFDLPYIWDRAAKLKVNSIHFCSRIADDYVKYKETTFSSKAYGTKKSYSLNLTGRITFDVMQFIQREYKLRSYSLNAVSKEFLGEQKDDVSHELIPKLFDGTADDRSRLAHYCYKDSYLVVRLIQKLMSILSYIEMCRTTWVPFSFLLSRGQSIKVAMQILQRCSTEDYVVPTKPAEYEADGKRAKLDDGEVGYEGAIVIEPTRGFYQVPIATLDFASLYPSIMQAHNLCYSTYCPPALNSIVEKMKLGAEFDYEKTPAGHNFVTKNKKRGILPRILDDLIAARNKAKDDMKNAPADSFEKELFNCRQLAIKISANSVYGFTGATIGPIPCVAISESVTSYGREMIMLTKDTVLEKYSIKNGFPFDAVVIYGDTGTYYHLLF